MESWRKYIDVENPKEIAAIIAAKASGALTEHRFEDHHRATELHSPNENTSEEYARKYAFFREAVTVMDRLWAFQAGMKS